MLLLALLLAAAVMTIFVSLGSITLVAWPPLAVAGYLLVRFPRDHAIITFDRLWIGGLLAYILLAHRRVPAAATSRFMKIGFGVFFLAFGIRAIAMSTSISGPIQTWVDSVVLPSIVFVAVSRYATTRERTQRFALSLMIAGGLLGAIGLAERIAGFELASLSNGQRRYDEVIGATRISGPYSVPETYALSLVICFAATLYWLQSRGRGPYIWGILIAALEVSGIVFSFFRAAWIAALLVVIGSFGIRPSRFGRTLVIAGVVGSLVFAGTTQLEQHNKAFEARTNNTDNIYGRLATYEQGIQLFKSAPLTGIGIDQYNAVVTDRAPVVFHKVKSVTFPHSSFIAVLAEQGLFGFVPLIFLSCGIWLVLRRIRAVASTSEEGVLAGSIAGAAAGYLIMSLTLTMLPYEPSNAFFAAFLGMTVGRLDVRSAETGRAVAQ
ncbi:MAG: O-antigen ligase family protein [Actinobacteria bacterium]|nr:O-antigen ligase family protein [Actinomycetota bacterium]